MDTKYSKTITKIILGLMFSFCFISLYSISVITTFIGTLFLAGALFELKNETSPFRKALTFSVVQLILQVVNIITQFATDNFRLIFDAVSAIILAFIIYNIFDGLRIVLYNCDTNKTPPLVLPLILYIITILTRIAMLLFKDNSIVRYVGMGICAAMFIIILILIINIADIIKKSDYTLNKDRLKLLYLAPLALVIIIGGAGFLIINGLNNASTKSVEYVQADTDEPETAASIRSEMVTAGFPDYIAQIIPDSEVLNYSTIFNSTSKTETIDIDGGRLKLTAVTSYMKLGKVRFLQYFEWEKLPNGKFVDLIGLCIETKKIVMLPDIDCDGYIFYDKDGKTLKAEYIDKDIALKYPKAKYKIVPGSENLKGYLAIDTTLAMSSVPAEYSTSLVYAHQKNIFNFPYADSFTFFRLGRQTEPNLAVFSKPYKLQVDEVYIPKNYKPEGEKSDNEVSE